MPPAARELANYISERLADYEHAREEMAAEHPDFQDYPDEEQKQTFYELYPDFIGCSNV